MRVFCLFTRKWEENKHPVPDASHGKLRQRRAYFSPLFIHVDGSAAPLQMNSSHIPFRLTLITPYHTLAALVVRLAPEYGCEVHTLEAVLDEVYQISEQCLAQQPEVLLSRGGTAEYLRSMVHDVPVVAIKTAPLDLLCALQPLPAAFATWRFSTLANRCRAWLTSRGRWTCASTSTCFTRRKKCRASCSFPGS